MAACTCGANPRTWREVIDHANSCEDDNGEEIE